MEEGPPGSNASRRNLLRILRTYGTEHKSYFIAGVITTVLTNIFAHATPLVLGTAINAVFTENGSLNIPFLPRRLVPSSQLDLFLFVAALIGLLSFGAVIFQAIQDWAWGKFSQNLQHEVRVDAYKASQRLDLSYFENSDTGEIMSILNNDVNELEEFFEEVIAVGIRMFVMTVGIAGFMLYLNWQLALVTMSVLPITAFIVYRYEEWIAPKYERKREQVGALNTILENNIGGIKTIKTYGTEETELTRTGESSRKYREIALNVIKVRTGLFAIVSGSSAFTFTITFLVGGYWVIVGPPLFFTSTLSVGTLVAFLIYADRFDAPIMIFTDVFDGYQNALAAANRITNIHEYDRSIRDDETAIDRQSYDGEVAYRDVSFGYEGADERALRDVDFRADAGEFVGVVGPTGSGKSTLMKLLPRLYEVDEGAVEVDGYDISKLSIKSLRGAIGYVSQEPYLFNSTVKENIAYGCRDSVTESDVIEAAKYAGAHEFITDLENEYETVVGERGVKLSGGQRQRIAIARAVVRDPDILILDEATSHVDTETEAIIQERLSTLTANRTTFAISHRLSTVRQADTILVMNDGELVEQGRHGELLEEDRLYAELWETQVGVSSAPVEPSD